MRATQRSARVVRVILGVAVLASAPVVAQAQNLGPFRQFLALEPYYTRTQLDVGEGRSKEGVNGYGGRLWVNLAPFSGPHWNLISHGALGLFATYSPRREGIAPSVWHVGAQHDAFFFNRPLGGFIDPFVSVAAGAFHTGAAYNPALNVLSPSTTRFALSPGGGIRVPIPNRLQLRGDVRDAIVFRSPTGLNFASRTTHNLEFQAALGITF